MATVPHLMQTPPVVGGALPVTDGSFVEFSRDVLGTLLRLHQKHGPIAALRDGTQKIVFLFDPAYNRQVLSDAKTYHARFFGIRGPKRSSQRRLTCGLLAMNGDQHRRNRRMVKEPFGMRQIAHYDDAILRFAEETTASWSDGQAVDVNEEMTRHMLRVTSGLLFGLDDNDLAYVVGEQIAEWVGMNHELGVGALVPNDEFSDRYEELLAYSEKLEKNVMELIRLRRADPKPSFDVLSILVRMHDAEGGLSDEELVGQACVLFGAAHMTTAHSFTWTLFLLAQHPSVMRRVWGAIEDGTIDREGENGEMALIDRVIKESMRVLPASGYSQRINNEPVRLGPFELMRGTPIVFTPIITHKLESTFENPRLFDPDRWLTTKPSGYEYHPFGGGPRLCIGGPLAMKILRTTLPRFLSEWRFTVEPGSDVTAEVRSTMLNPKNGVRMRLNKHAEAGPTFTASPIRGNIDLLADLPEAPEAPAA
ncbi:cytochrome P450 [Pseudobythopirellula maris]|nr:cytochrome P450 [Pseudobythopirellula maris]